VKYFLIGLSAFFFVSCSPHNLQNSNMTPYEKGEKLFRIKCSSCHALPQKDKFASNQWDTILVKMSNKAHLRENEIHLIKGYLTNQN